MAARKKAKAERPSWPGQGGSEDALFAPMAETAWCSFKTVAWLSDRTGSVALAIPGFGAPRVGDVPGGERIVGSWSGLALRESSVDALVVDAQRSGAAFHVRLEEGERHEGRFEDCRVGVCLVEKVMSE